MDIPLYARQVEFGNCTAGRIRDFANMEFTSFGRGMLKRAGCFMSIENKCCVPKAQLIAIPEHLLFDGFLIHKAIAASMIVTQYITALIANNTGLFTMDRNV